MLFPYFWEYEFSLKYIILPTKLYSKNVSGNRIRNAHSISNSFRRTNDIVEGIKNSITIFLYYFKAKLFLKI